VVAVDSTIDISRGARVYRFAARRLLPENPGLTRRRRVSRRFAAHDRRRRGANQYPAQRFDFRQSGMRVTILPASSARSAWASLKIRHAEFSARVPGSIAARSSERTVCTCRSRARGLAVANRLARRGEGRAHSFEHVALLIGKNDGVAMA